MTKNIFIENLKAGMQVESIFLVAEKELRQKKGGTGEYLYMILKDKTGSVTTFMWDNFEKIHKSIEPGILIKARGNVQVYQNKLQLVLQNMEIYSEEAEISDFLPSTKENIELLYKKVMEAIDTLKSKELKILLKNIFTNPEYKPLILKAPAAKTYHHACIGGLLEHIVSLIGLCENVLKHYYLERDILISGILLHDIGKIWEFNSSGFFDYTKQGKMLGHIIMGVQLLEKETNKIDGFPKDLKEHLTHLIISHHGELEFGSPKRPKTKEALLLHFLDLIDSQLKGFDEIIEANDSDSAYSSQLGRYIFKT